MSTKKRALSILEPDLGPVTFGLFMRVARTSLNLTQVEMARKLKISKSTLCDIEKGRQLVSPELAAKIAKKAGFPVIVAVKACLQDQLKKAKLNLTVELTA